MTYHPTLNSLSKIIRDNMYLLIIWMKKLGKLFHQVLWSHFEVHESLAFIWFGLSYIYCKEKYVPQNVVNDDVKFTIM